MVGQPERAIRVLYGLRASRALAKDVFSFAETRLGCAETRFARFQAAYADVWGCVKMDEGRLGSLKPLPNLKPLQEIVNSPP